MGFPGFGMEQVQTGHIGTKYGIVFVILVYWCVLTFLFGVKGGEVNLYVASSSYTVKT
jgi:hypothetical protein